MKKSRQLSRKSKSSSGFTPPLRMPCSLATKFNTMRSRAGFTILELAIVIAVIAIIVSGTVIDFFSLHTEAKDSKAKSDLRVIRLAVETYSARKMVYPDDILLIEGGSVIAKLPKDPFTENENYHLFSSHGYFAIWSVGFNGESGVVTITPAGLVNDTDPDDIGLTNGACPNKFWNVFKNGQILECLKK